METKTENKTEFNLDTDDIKTLHRHPGKVIGNEKKIYVVGYTERGKLYVVTANVRPSHFKAAEVRFDKGVAGDFMFFFTNRHNPFSMLVPELEPIIQGTAHLPRESYGNGMQYFDTFEQVVEFIKNMYNKEKERILKKANEIDEFVSTLSVETFNFTTPILEI